LAVVNDWWLWLIGDGYWVMIEWSLVLIQVCIFAYSRSLLLRLLIFIKHQP
jgi:hypothetical protein